ncbi:MAG: hypothetical protein GEV06_12850 [Luteitalea sp.]|nr:hypothetical protein [Luteitalea sp.]
MKRHKMFKDEGPGVPRRTFFASVPGAGVALGALSRLWSVQQPDPPTIRLSNGHLELAFDGRNGRLLRLFDEATKQDFVAGATQGGDVWALNIAAADEQETIAPARASAFRSEQSEEHSVTLIWEDFDLKAAPDLRVEVSVSLEPDTPMSRWNISLENVGDLALDRVRFPRVVGIPDLGNERLAVPQWMGQLAKNPRRLGIREGGGRQRWEWAYPGALSLQCLALYGHDGPGLYTACDDTAAFWKTFAFWADDAGMMNYEMSNAPGQAEVGSGRYALPYGALIGTFAGDWVTAAERYRAWGIEQAWCRESRLARGLVPTSALETGLWEWNRGRSAGVLGPAALLRSKLGLPVRVFWHWWHGCAYDHGFPEYLPPREGAGPFRRALAKAHEVGLRAIVYMNQRLWCSPAPSWKAENAERFAVRDRDGELLSEVYNTFTKAQCQTMCMATSFWRDKYAGLAEAAVQEYDVDGVYMDQACSSVLCYSQDHGHPPGGGNYWLPGFAKLTSDIRTRAKGARDLILAGEGCGEAWLPHLDLFLTLQVSRERYLEPGGDWEVIPFFQAVYHDYGVSFGNYSSLTAPPYDDLWPAETAPNDALQLLDARYNGQFLLEQARAFVWGLQPMIANFLPSQLEERGEQIAYLLRLARLRNQGLKYLLYGSFLRPPRTDVPEVKTDLLRLSIYAGQDSAANAWHNSFPAVQCGAWLAKDGDVGVAVANITDKPVPMRFTLTATEQRLPESGRINRIGEEGREEIGQFQNGRASVNIELPPLGAYILDFTKTTIE